MHNTMYESLARERMREVREDVQAARLESRVASTRRWRRVARFADARANRARTRSAQTSVI